MTSPRKHLLDRYDDDDAMSDDGGGGKRLRCEPDLLSFDDPLSFDSPSPDPFFFENWLNLGSNDEAHREETVSPSLLSPLAFGSPPSSPSEAGPPGTPQLPDLGALSESPASPLVPQLLLPTLDSFASSTSSASGSLGSPESPGNAMVPPFPLEPHASMMPPSLGLEVIAQNVVDHTVFDGQMLPNIDSSSESPDLAVGLPLESLTATLSAVGVFRPPWTQSMCTAVDDQINQLNACTKSKKCKCAPGQCHRMHDFALMPSLPQDVRDLKDVRLLGMRFICRKEDAKFSFAALNPDKPRPIKGMFPNFGFVSRTTSLNCFKGENKSHPPLKPKMFESPLLNELGLVGLELVVNKKSGHPMVPKYKDEPKRAPVL
eukprot:m.299665 g.299665  ORF g.299665 m.299665 type:complete len:374 (+) comp14211_c0_seq1:38-1159(+)